MANKMQGQLRVANDLATDVRPMTDIGQMPESSLPQAAAQASAVFSNIGSRIGQIADAAAIQEGEEAGRAAGLDPEFRTQRSNTLRSNAFDKAGLDVAETRLRQQVDADFDAAFDASGGSASKLTGDLAARRVAILQNAPQELRPGLEVLMKGKGLAYARELARRAAAERAAEAKAAAEQQLGDTMKGLHQRAFALGLDPMADEVLAQDAAALAKTLGRRGPDGRRMFSPEAAAEALDKVKETVATARLTGAFQRLPSIAEKEQFIRQFEADYAKSDGLAKVYDFAGFERMRSSLESDLRSAKAEASAATRIVADEVKSVAERAEKGFAPPPAEMAAIRSRVTSLGDKDLAQALAVAEDTLSFQSSARKATPAELESYVQGETQRMQAGGASPQAVARLGMAEKLLDTQRTELKRDPLGWAARSEVMRIAPLDLTSDEAAASSFKIRMAQAEEVATYYGQEPKYLTPEEGRALAAAAAKGGKPMIGIASMLAVAAKDRAPSVLAEVFEHAPAIAMLGGHVAAAGVTQVAQDAANGIALIKTDGVKPLAPSAADARREAVAVAGTALQSMPKSEAAAIALANAAYEVRARQKGVTEFDAALWRSALREVLGERTINGEIYGGVASAGSWWQGGGLKKKAVIVPPNVKQSGFSELVAAVQIEDLAATGGVPLHGDGKPATAEAIRRARLVQVGDASYWLSLGDDEDPQYLKSGRDEPYVLDLKALEPRLMRRRPDLYLGGR